MTIQGSIDRRGLLGLAGGLALAPMLGAKAMAQSTIDTAEVDALCRAMIEAKATPGFTIAAMKAGQLVYSRGFGSANLETGTPMDTNSVVRIGSVTKQYTAAGIAALAEDGALSLDDTLARFIPDFPDAEHVTIRQILTHTAGLGNYTDTDPPTRFWQDARLDYTEEQLLTVLKSSTPLYKFPPGTAYAYSNTGYVLLGLVAQRAAGKSYATFMKERIFDRAGLTATAVDDAAEIVPHRAAGYSPAPTRPAGFEHAPFIFMPYAGAAGAVRSTPEDMCRWHAALLGGRVLNPASLRAMTTPALLADGQPAHSLASADRPARPVQYGFGLSLSEVDDRPCISHGGGIQGFASWLGTFTEMNVTIAFNCNCLADLGAQTAAIRQRLLASLV